MILDFLFPKYCLECKKEGKYICDMCISKVTPCGTIGNNYSIFKYEGVIRKAIISLKYKFATDIADELSERIHQRLIAKGQWLKNITLVPIPLHRKRENWRGFNQSEILGKKLSEKMKWKFIPDLLIRNKNTAPQVGLKGLSRRSNLSGVFSINSHIPYSIIHNSIVLFDDVYTTGSTINEAKKVLKEAGFYPPKADQPWTGNIRSLTIAR